LEGERESRPRIQQGYIRVGRGKTAEQLRADKS